MKIGELSRRTGVSVRMLRYYEGEGLLVPQRTSSGYRDYGPADEEAVRRIKVLGSAGMTLETIKQLLPCVRNNRPDFQPCDNLRRILAQQVGLIDQRIEALSQSRTILAGFISSVN
ncbi:MULTISPECIES: MerR family transcriptional regulator [Bradyrhizobium]|jgi:DNA-binding transcriptional MerR regulator|uniref:MerR family transcriptional regulator n=1 Tax=Bradyrhizobium aeschynomenes TaxID=2734909 RepID=A0ABX2CMW5_9BRAD|nr:MULTISPECIES: MerR family transcriptional regulator [Bradyrhizobium]NPU69506.1 MerR family transcriptional regulator [Bradyrhizobium aeschynomenes]NPV25418.1 MerR family transcriptional regulator [Bradyrhizobium aeschynomenes]